MIVLMKFVCVEKLSNLRNIFSSNVPYFLKKGKSSRIKFMILTAHLLTKMKTLCYIFLFGKENMNVSKNAHILNATIEYILSEKGSTCLCLNKSKPLQFITTTVINDSIVIELNIPF